MGASTMRAQTTIMCNVVNNPTMTTYTESKAVSIVGIDVVAITTMVYISEAKDIS